MKKSTDLTRRGFIKALGIAGGAALLAGHLPTTVTASSAGGGPTAPASAAGTGGNLTVAAAIESVRKKQQTVTAITTRCLDRIAADTSGNVVWVTVDRELAMAEARAVDARLAAGEKLPLAGVCLGVKDLFAIKGLPMRCGSPLTSAAPSAADARLVAQLKKAGAVIVGTTSMPNFAYGPTPGAFNPYNREHTAGSSSTGSAIAVAAGQVPATLAMQTNASVIRPATFCGVAAFKPTQGVLSIEGGDKLAPSLDQPGFMAKDMTDLTILYDVLTGQKPQAVAKPSYAFVRTIMWEKADVRYRTELEKLAAGLKAKDMELPAEFAEIWKWLDCIMEYEFAQNLPASYATNEAVAPPMRESLQRGLAISKEAYDEALAARARLVAWGRKTLEPFACVITPAAAGPAPLLKNGSGSPVFSTIWSLMGAPCATIPLYRDNGLPVGVQLVGAPGQDARVLAAALEIEAQIGRS